MYIMYNMRSLQAWTGRGRGQHSGLDQGGRGYRAHQHATRIRELGRTAVWRSRWCARVVADSDESAWEERAILREYRVKLMVIMARPVSGMAAAMD